MKENMFGTKEIKEILFELLGVYAVSTNEKLKYFVRNKIYEGKISVSQIKNEYILIGSGINAVHYTCADICYYEYLLKDFSFERILEILEISDCYSFVKEICRSLIASNNKDNNGYVLAKKYLETEMEIEKKYCGEEYKIFECRIVHGVYLWVNELYNSFVHSFFKNFLRTTSFNLERIILRDCNRLTEPLLEDEEIKSLIRKTERKLEKISEKSKDEIIEGICIRLCADFNFKSIIYNRNKFDFGPYENISFNKLTEKVTKAYNDTIYNYIIIAYSKKIKEINNDLRESKTNQIHNIFSNSTDLNISDIIKKSKNIKDSHKLKQGSLVESVITESADNRTNYINNECSKTEVQKILMTIDYDKFIDNTIITYYINEMKSSNIDNFKTIFINKLLGKNYQETSEISDLKNKIITLTGENEIYSRENASLKQENDRLRSENHNDKVDSLIRSNEEKSRSLVKKDKEIDKLKDNEAEKDIQIALLKQEIEHLKRPAKEDNEIQIDTNLRYMFVCINENLKLKLLKWFPNSIIFDFNKDISVNHIDAIVVMTGEVKHREYWPAKNYASRHKIPLVHCPVINYEAICKTIAECLG